MGRYPYQMGTRRRHDNLMRVAFYNYDANALHAKLLFHELNAGLGNTITTFDEMAEFTVNGNTVGIVSLNIGDYEVYLDIYAPGCQFTRGVLRRFFNHVFAIHPRATAIVAAENAHCQQFLLRVGFQKEGVLRRAFDGHQDAIYFGILEEDWAASPLAK